MNESARRAAGLGVGACAAVAFAQTIAYSIYLRDDPGNYNGAGAQGDQVAYIDLAQQVLHGTWQGAVHYMPGLPAVLALCQLIFGDARFGVAVVQGLIFGGLVVSAALLAAQAFGPRSSVWAAAAVGLNPAIGYYAAQALTEFLTGTALFATVAGVFIWTRRPSVRNATLIGVCIGAAAYLRAEYLALAPLIALVLVWIGRRRALIAGLALIATTIVAIAPWSMRYAVATGSPVLYNESPLSNLVLMGTWFRVFDEQTFSQLQRIETDSGLTRDEAIARAAHTGSRPELSGRYMEQARGPYERPLGVTLALAIGNVQLNTRQYLVNHLVLAPVLIWAGHTPLRQADAQNLPSTARYAIWSAELALLALALWHAVDSVRRWRGSADLGAASIGLSFLAIVAFLTVVHVLIAVDERFTAPALPMAGMLAGSRLAFLASQLAQRLHLGRRAALRYPA